MYIVYVEESLKYMCTSDTDSEGNASGKVVPFYTI